MRGRRQQSAIAARVRQISWRGNGSDPIRSVRKVLRIGWRLSNDAAHGTSTPANDATETAAIKSVFGDHAAKLKINSTKSMTGYLLGAAGAVEAIVSSMMIHTGKVHPTINYSTPDPECDLDYVPGQARKTHPRTALSNSFGFGGHNATLIFRLWEG